MNLHLSDAEIARAKEQGCKDLYSLVSRRVALKRRGGTWWGLCPFHKEKSPSFKLDKKGFYKCHGCGAGGDAIKWLMAMESMSFVEAVRALLNNWLPQGLPMTAPAYAPKPLDDRDSRIDALRIWSKALPAKGTVVEEYLRRRGIKPRRSAFDHLKYAPLLHYGPTKEKYPAMIAQLTDDHGFCCIQRTFLDRNSPEKLKIPGAEGRFLPARFTKGAMAGSAVRFGEPVEGELGIAEGVETALSASQLYTLPVWAVCGLSRLKTIELPRVRKLYIFGDPGDVGRQGAFDAQDFYEAKGLTVEVIFPADAFSKAGLALESADYNDVLQVVKK